jgi:hypothetical protein
MACYDDTFVLDDTYIEEAWKNAELQEIEDLAAALLGKAQEAQSIEDDLIRILYLAFRCGFKTAIRSNRIGKSESIQGCSHLISGGTIVPKRGPSR